MKNVNLFDSEFINSSSNEIADNETKTYNKELIHRALVQLPEACQKVLTLYYFNDYDIESVSRELGYKNTNVTKKKKCDCMKKLAEIVKQMQKIKKI